MIVRLKRPVRPVLTGLFYQQMAFWPLFCCKLGLQNHLLNQKQTFMKKIMPAIMAFTTLFLFSNCSREKTVTQQTDDTEIRGAAAATKVYYDFVVSTSAGCNGHVLTINDCGDGSYKTWQSTKNCNGGNSFNGTVAGSGNPLLLTNPATFPIIGATYNIFNNFTTATRDVLSVTFKPGYNASHKPTISYNPSTRKFTVTNAGNPAFITVTVFSYTGIIAPGVLEFC
jgi:hypothetical protein